MAKNTKKKYICSLDSSDNLYKSLIPYTIFLFLHNVYFMMFFSPSVSPFSLVIGFMMNIIMYRII